MKRTNALLVSLVVGFCALAILLTAIPINLSAQSTTTVNGIVFYGDHRDYVEGAVFVLTEGQRQKFDNCVQHTDAWDCISGDYTYRAQASSSDGTYTFQQIPNGKWTFIAMDTQQSNKAYDEFSSVTLDGKVNPWQRDFSITDPPSHE
jgi:hypothetical protein